MFTVIICAIAVSPRPNPPLAFAGALAMLAHLSGRSYIDERGTHTNLYLAALAPTATGGQNPIGFSVPRITYRFLGEGFSSTCARVNAVEKVWMSAGRVDGSCVSFIDAQNAVDGKAYKVV